MIITNEALEWTSDDAANLAVWLTTKTGARFLPKVLESSPENLPAGEINAVLIRSGEVRGWQAFARTILSLMAVAPPPVQEQIAYPALDNDQAWNDGQKLDNTGSN